MKIDRDAPIGVFDSGVGGLTVAREIMRNLPSEKIVYFGDTARVPYGSKSKETIIRYSRQIIHFLREQQVKAIVIACNTATSAAVALMRKKYDIPIIGMEPAVKKAVDLFLQKNLNGCYKMSNQKEEQLYQEDPLSDFVYTNQAYHDILEYIKYVSDEDHLKHIPDYFQPSVNSVLSSWLLTEMKKVPVPFFLAGFHYLPPQSHLLSVLKLPDMHKHH